MTDTTAAPARALPRTLVLVGAGKMGGAMLKGWLAAGLDPQGVAVIDPHPAPEMAAAARDKGFRLNPEAQALGAPEVLVLATKPQMLDEAAAALRPLAGPQTMVISILAGKTLRDLSARLPQAGALVRAMPNLPASIGSGATAAVANPSTTAAQKHMAAALLSAVGLCEWLDDEALIDAVTAVSGSGPAYVFLLAEALAQAGIEAGLPADLSARLAQATVSGAGDLMRLSQEAPDQLRRNVTSPGGTTAAALHVLMAEDKAGEGLQGLLGRAVAAAKRRAAELSG